MTPWARRAAGLGAILAGLALVLQTAPSFEPARRALTDGFGPEGSEGGRSVRLLRELGVESGGWPIGEAEDAPSTKAVPPGMRHEGQWLVSVATPEESLHDPLRGILANPHGRGRDWERIAWVSLFDGDRLVLATRAGLRFHGSSGRDAGREAFRVILRPSYGMPHLPLDAPLSTAARPADRFVVRRFQTMPQAQPFAFDIARRTGAVAPAAQSVRFVLNGSMRPQPYELSEHVSREGWGRGHFGHDDFRFYQFRALAQDDDEAAYLALRDWIRDAPAPLRMTQVAERIDVDRFIRHVLTIVYCGTRDWAQGAAVLDLRRADARWFWVHWDLDQSFWSLDPEPWTRPSMALFTSPTRTTERSDARAILLQRLLQEDPAFVERFSALAAQMLNHVLTREFLTELVDRYGRLAVLDVPFGGFDMTTFVERRGDVVLAAIAEATDQVPPATVQIEAPAGVRLDVDGHAYGRRYSGRYFAGQTLAVRASGDDGRPRGLWTVNGSERIGEALDIRVEGDTTILLVD